MRIRFLAPTVAVLATLATISLTDRSLAAPSTAQDAADRVISDSSRGKGSKISSSVASALLQAQKEDANHQLDTALADAHKAEAAAQNNYEKLKVNQILTQIYADQQDIPNAAKAAEAAADLEGAPDSELPDVLTNACLLATAVYDYDKAAIYAHKMQALSLSDDRSKRIIATALENEPKKPVTTAAH